MKALSTFYFENFSFHPETQKAYFGYSFDREEFFTEEIDFSSDTFSMRSDIDSSCIQSLLFHCHIALGISYYKLFPTKNLMILSGNIDQEQAEFWKKFYLNGLGEFFIQNNIKPHDLLNFSSESCITYHKQDIQWSDRALLPWWWWKDSIVSSILLEKSNISATPYVFWKIDAIKSSTLTTFWSPALQVTRTLSDHLFKMNADGYYNGHVPITGIIACISFVTAYMYDYTYIILSNEYSADEGNTLWEWMNINHQYSKSFEFEKDLKKYSEKYITSDIQYFSLLRWFHEYKIAEIFANSAGKYFSSFSSCNKNFTLTTDPQHTWNWCGKCEKCAFVYLMFSAFLSPSQVKDIFWSHLFEDPELLNDFSGLIWHDTHKPFECVGTYEESIYAMYRSIQKYNHSSLPYVLEKLSWVVEKEVTKLWGDYFEKKLGKIHNEDIIPAEIKSCISLFFI